MKDMPNGRFVHVLLSAPLSDRRELVSQFLERHRIDEEDCASSRCFMMAPIEAAYCVPASFLIQTHSVQSALACEIDSAPEKALPFCRALARTPELSDKAFCELVLVPLLDAAQEKEDPARRALALFFHQVFEKVRPGLSLHVAERLAKAPLSPEDKARGECLKSLLAMPFPRRTAQTTARLGRQLSGVSPRPQA